MFYQAKVKPRAAPPTSNALPQPDTGTNLEHTATSENSGRPNAIDKEHPSSDSAARSSRGAHPSTRRRLIDVMVQTIYECSMYENDKVQLQVIKALLTAVTSVTCKVHGQSLLLAVRAC